MRKAPDLDAVRALLVESDYAPVSLIARGGMADVFRVEHRFLGRSFALKLIHSEIAERPGFLDRLLLEAKILGRLESPHIVEVVDLWVQPSGFPLLFLELLEGQTLAEKLTASGRLSIGDALEWTQQLLSALAEAHAEGLVHRDIKPGNLFLHAAEGFPTLLKVLDFGLARVLAEEASPTASFPSIRTSTGAMVGSAGYMSPEALRGERVDARADLFATAVVLYEMLMGFGPFDRSESIPPPSAARPEISGKLETSILRGLALEPSERFQSAREFSDSLREARAAMIAGA